MEALGWKELINIVKAIATAEFNYLAGLVGESCKLPEHWGRFPWLLSWFYSPTGEGRKAFLMLMFTFPV